MSRIISWFSCGAASAVATKLALVKHPDLIIAYTEVIEEHHDNPRFLKDCEKWFGREVLILGNDEYGRSIYRVFEEVKYMAGVAGAPCTRLLKRGVREKFQLPGDIQVFGFTADAKDVERANRMLDANPDVKAIFPLIDAGLYKRDVLAMIERAGIELPTMYRLGYQNNNCVGCVKGQAGYWNKIRRDFPEVFDRMAAMEERIGCKLVKREWGSGDSRGMERLTLRELPEDLGREPEELEIECGIMCYVAETTYKELAR